MDNRASKHAVSVAIWRPPFADGAPKFLVIEPQDTIADVVARISEGMDLVLQERLVVHLTGNGGKAHRIDRELWERIRLKPGQTLTLQAAPAGGGGEGGKQGAAVLVAVATVLTAGLASAGAFATGGLFAAGTTSATLLAGGINFLGSLAQRAVSRPPASRGREATGQQGRGNGPASLAGNVLAPGADIPRVLGTRRIFPVLLTQPLIERIGDEEIAEGVFALAGPHLLSDPEQGGAPIDATDDIEIQYREGRADDLPIDLIERFSHTATPNAELIAHKVETDDQDKLKNQADPEKSLPVFTPFSTADGFDECWLYFTMPQGLSKDASTSADQVIALRGRMKLDGTDQWKNLPELHFAAADLNQLKPSIKLVRGTGPASPGTIATTRGFVAAFVDVPEQVAPNDTGEGWQAHESFSDGAGDTWIERGNESGSRVSQIVFDGQEVTLYLDEADFPDGRWTIEFKRSVAFTKSSLTRSTYLYGGVQTDFFHWQSDNGTAVSPETRKGFADRLFLASIASIRNRHPVARGAYGPGVALMAVKVSNREMREFSVKASGLVETWDGTGFTGLAASSNPADQIYHILRNDIAALPLEEELVETDSLAAFHAHCVAGDHTCDMVVEGALTDELLSKVAGCGFGRVRASEVWGVIRDRDRRGETHVQVFSGRNKSGLTTSIAFDRIPDGIRYIFIKADTSRELSGMVWREGRENVAKPLIEEIRIEGIVDEAKVRAQVAFRLKEIEARNAFYSFRAPPEAIVCEAGDLIAVNDRSFSPLSQSARIERTDIVDGDLQGVWLDARVELADEDDMHGVSDMHSVSDMHRVGLKSAMMIRRSDGTFSTHEIAVPDERAAYVLLETPAALAMDANGVYPVRNDNLVTFGHSGSEINRRMIVTGMTFTKGYQAAITAVADASEELYA